MPKKMIEQEFNRNQERDELQQYSFVAGMYFGFMLLELLFTIIYTKLLTFTK